MKHLIYLSTAVNLMNSDELTALLTTARQKNNEHNVTGVLLYSDGTFIQVLEGASADIDLIYEAIERDVRHKNIIKLIEEPVEERIFPQWSMRFSAINAEKGKELEGCLTSIADIENNSNKSSAISILKTFIISNKLSVS